MIKRLSFSTLLFFFLPGVNPTAAQGITPESTLKSLMTTYLTWLQKPEVDSMLAYLPDTVFTLVPREKLRERILEDYVNDEDLSFHFDSVGAPTVGEKFVFGGV